MILLLQVLNCSSTVMTGREGIKQPSATSFICPQCKIGLSLLSFKNLKPHLPHIYCFVNYNDTEAKRRVGMEEFK